LVSKNIIRNYVETCRKHLKRYFKAFLKSNCFQTNKVFNLNITYNIRYYGICPSVRPRVYYHDLGGRLFYFLSILCIIILFKLRFEGILFAFTLSSVLVFLWERMYGAGVERARLFSWERAAREMLEVFRELK
jgi:hypothetical protein